MKRFLTISPREGSALHAASSATSGTGSSSHFAAANSTKRKFDDANYDKEKRKRPFQDQWFGEFPWLSYTSGNATMVVCMSEVHKIIRSKECPCKFRKDPLYKHEKSNATLPASISSATSTERKAWACHFNCHWPWYLGST